MNMPKRSCVNQAVSPLVGLGLSMGLSPGGWM